MSKNEIIDKVDAIISEFSNKLESSLDGISSEIYENILNEISSLDRVNGDVKTSIDNLKKVNSINGKINDIVLNDTYLSNINEYSKGFNEIQSVMSGYFSTISTQFELKELYDALRIANVDITVNSLTASGISQALEVPIRKIITDSVVNGTSYKELKELLRTEILGNKDELGALERYVSQITHDAMFQYQGNYIKTVTSDLNLEWYIYQGAKQNTSRCFCIERVNLYFHKKEVEHWGKTPSLWDSCKKKGNKGGGRIPDTNQDTIFQYRGGYNCRHQILPVDRLVVSEIDKERAKKLGYI